ncbi:MAG: YggS family pyridoxal phosphate-dependent enzyme [Verrucomicrobia bacterium CG_4_10_14_3_um_filter_43_23]|nr:MAG: YggS family pyridoxal phosphate enzyme [Verrucomicrobia bacterium CG1_02_43_26]PIP58531.1 MAG: YggS family pyridoxal phosphate-dependent enzyme [Verrucomicrobia bacterium CG22_combo_CG10-13_8_21_14_all_43_17]PIX58329.1 MAG: YggS family pyridoxal phosphate-dependent enzyme [Verrucomicrobia bacterium CG_4_10_14_3_um_filter_43_23]PIY60856.1 MAG: YggS family pyridoxal phosphate-dependent enzyme [Verrucomicrobia bacterium CG_4_10_14_0_8_um_filter_43_34]PJA44346.1 MAG: YggS family pyridoxal p
MISYTEFQENLKDLNQQIVDACAACGREASSVRILPVTKTFPVEAVEYAYKAGFLSIGENRVQEAIAKKEGCNASIEWELIGHLQSNKVNAAVSLFDRIQSVDSLKLLSKINHAAELEGKTIRILVQVNAGKDPAKFGLSIRDTKPFFQEALTFRHLKIEGLMTIAPLDEDLSVAREAFSNLRKIRDQLVTEFGIALPELSMGMTADLQEAIREGSTMVRVGSGLFGSRTA